MNTDAPGKVRSHHLGRSAYLYVRQSSLRQVLEHTESTERQYALKQRAVALGWHHEQVVVVDSDLGQSAASTSDREGFQQLVTEVSLGRAGIVMGLEVSRLARNSTDWHRLLEICALADTLILDEDGIYDPAHFNDRLLLGLKGTMSEAELHLLRARLIGGMMNKARRGELRMRLPVGFAYDGADRVVLDPDQQVQQALRVFFETFRRVGSATATVKEFRRLKLRFPRRVQHGARKGETLWGELEHHRRDGDVDVADRHREQHDVEVAHHHDQDAGAEHPADDDPPHAEVEEEAGEAHGEERRVGERDARPPARAEQEGGLAAAGEHHGERDERVPHRREQHQPRALRVARSRSGRRRCCGVRRHNAPMLARSATPHAAARVSRTRRPFSSVPTGV